MPVATRTGRFPVGFRRGWSDWQKDLPGLVAFAKAEGFAAVDVGNDGDVAGAAVKAAGLRVGSVDLKDWGGMLSPDAGRRQAAVAANTAYVKACAAALGPVNHFVVMLPEQPEGKRAEHFAHMVASFSQLAPVMEQAKARLVIEGWPGPGALCCTPETYREFFRQVPSAAMAVNFDPSHLIRMGVDPMRFLREFAPRVAHVHGKDARLFPDALYECGWEQPPVFHPSHGFGSAAWRYTLPGHGTFDWPAGFAVLQAAGYAGCVCVELEDESFNGTTAGEQAGLRVAKAYLEGC